MRDNKPLTWLGALPDALKKVDKEDYQEILGENITPESFKNLNCDNTTIAAISANARCYTTVMYNIPTENIIYKCGSKKFVHKSFCVVFMNCEFNNSIYPAYFPHSALITLFVRNFIVTDPEHQFVQIK